MFVIRGIEISRDGGDKFVKVVIQKDFADRYKVIRKKANVHINKGLVINYAAGHFGIPPGKIAWPHHIDVIDIE